MKVYHTARFKRQFRKLSLPIQEKFYKQTEHLKRNLRHPSLHAKKFDEAEGIWQARVDRDVRFYFVIEADTYVLLEIRHHPK